MVQGQAARVPAQAGVGAKARARVEAGWAAHLPPGRVEVVYARNAAPLPLILPDSLVRQ